MNTLSTKFMRSTRTIRSGHRESRMTAQLVRVMIWRTSWEQHQACVVVRSVYGLRIVKVMVKKKRVCRVNMVPASRVSKVKELTVWERTVQRVPTRRESKYKEPARGEHSY